MIRWLHAFPCAPPCVEGITPGETTAAEALRMLQANPLVAPGGVHRYARTLEVKWKPSNYGGWIVSYEGSALDTKVTSIVAAYDVFRLADVMTYYGEPTHVMAYAYPDRDHPSQSRYYLTLVYLSHGFRLESARGWLAPLVVGKDARFVRVVFYPVMDEETFLTHDEVSGTGTLAARRIIVPWQGEQPFEFYCKELEAGADACQQYRDRHP